MTTAQETVKMCSSDGHTFDVAWEVAIRSRTVKNLIEDNGTEETIPLPNVSGSILARVIEYCKYHVNVDRRNADGQPVETREDIERWDADFVKVDQTTLFDLILAANYLNIEGLLDVTCQTVAKMIKGKTPEEIRKQFNIKNDFTPEEEDEIRRENQWAFE